MEYYKHHQMLDGHLNICKECIKKNAMTRRELSPDKLREYELKRRNEANRVAARRKTTKRRRNEVDGYLSAHNAAARAVKAGKLNKPSNCEVCGDDGRIEAHHNDYSKPLEVVWLCVRCHRRIHTGKTNTAIKIKNMVNG